MWAGVASTVQMLLLLGMSTVSELIVYVDCADDGEQDGSREQGMGMSEADIQQQTGDYEV